MRNWFLQGLWPRLQVLWLNPFFKTGIYLLIIVFLVALLQMCGLTADLTTQQANTNYRGHTRPTQPNDPLPPVNTDLTRQDCQLPNCREPRQPDTLELPEILIDADIPDGEDY